jgi:hypothetical protein
VRIALEVMQNYGDFVDVILLYATTRSGCFIAVYVAGNMLPQHTLHLHQTCVTLAAMEAYKYCNMYDPRFKPMDTRGLI